jgi:hypothetical protein
MRQDARMGDKGGKKDREKNKQQQLRKQKEEEQKKQDKARAKTPQVRSSAPNAIRMGATRDTQPATAG